MADNGQQQHTPQAGHAPHDSALSVSSSKDEDAAKIRDLEEKVTILADKANNACMLYAACATCDCVC